MLPRSLDNLLPTYPDRTPSSCLSGGTGRKSPLTTFVSGGTGRKSLLTTFVSGRTGRVKSFGYFCERWYRSSKVLRVLFGAVVPVGKYSDYFLTGDTANSWNPARQFRCRYTSRLTISRACCTASLTQFKCALNVRRGLDWPISQSREPSAPWNNAVRTAVGGSRRTPLRCWAQPNPPDDVLCGYLKRSIAPRLVLSLGGAGSTPLV